MKTIRDSISKILLNNSRRLLFLAAMVLIVVGCRDKTETIFQGYAEGEYVLVASPIAGRLEKLAVQRGSQVRAGELLFVLEQTQEQAAMAAAEQEVNRAQSRLADLRKGQRPSELDATRARREQAQAALDYSQQEFNRRKELLATKAISQEDFDQAQATLNHDRALLAELDAQLKTAGLGARSDAVAAGLAELEAARAKSDQVRWSLEQKSQNALADALVFDTLFDPGEFVPAGYPVVSLLPPGNIKLRFFVPETRVGSLKTGQAVAVSYDGAAAPLTATISYISPQVEYTPPVIYSRDTRAKLVFLVEARPDKKSALLLHPGQPVDVRLEPLHE
jgi:HlyD family secretion protein